MGVVKSAMKTAAICLAVGTPLAVTVFEVIGGPASVAGSSMQVKTVVKFRIMQCSVFLVLASPVSTQKGAERAMLCG